MKETRSLGQILVDEGIVSSQQLQQAETIQQKHGSKLHQALLHLGYLTENELLACLADLPGTTSVDIQQYAIDPALRDLVPAELARKHEVMPVDRLGRNLTVAMAVPLDAQTQAELEDATGNKVRAILCDASIVRSTIDRHYLPIEDLPEGPVPRDHQDAFQPTVLRAASTAPVGAPAPVLDAGPEELRLQGALAIVDSLEHMPLLPDVHLRILERLEDPRVDIEELTPLIERDPNLAANLLKLANSAAYSVRNPLASVRRAIAFLGLRELGSIVLSSAVLQQLSAQAEFELSGVFRQSFQCGLLTKIIAKAAGLGDHEVGFTAGLLANIGTIALRIYSDQCDAELAEGAATTGRSRAALEEERLGITASEVGYHLAQRWNIPEQLAEVIRYHDRLDTPAEVSALTVGVALALQCIGQFEATGQFGDPAADPALASLVARAGLEATALPGIEDAYRDGLEDLAIP